MGARSLRERDWVLLPLKGVAPSLSTVHVADNWLHLQWASSSLRSPANPAPKRLKQFAACTVDLDEIQTEPHRPVPREEDRMQSVALTKLRSDFTAAISSDQNELTLDPSIAEFREEISEPAYLASLSIYSRGQLREMNDALSQINNARLKDDPLLVALAVDAVLKLFDRLEITVRQSAESDKRIEAARVS